MRTQRLLQRFYQLIGESDAANAKQLGLESFSIGSFMAMSLEKIWEIIKSEDIHESLNKLNLIYYWLAYRELRIQASGESLKDLQFKFNHIALGLKHYFPTAEFAEVEKGILRETQKTDTHYTNLQILRGSRCNVRCQMCFIHKLDKDLAIEVDALRFLQHVRDVDYTQNGLFKAMLHARVAYGLKEVLFSSFGDPTANTPALLPYEIALAKELRFEQITLLTNGVALSFRALSEMVESGLTHLTISIHTSQPKKHALIVQPYRTNAHERLLKLVQKANEKGLVAKGLTIRFNVAYSKMLLEDESIPSMIAFAHEAGAQQITFIEMILANEWAEEQYVRMPDEIPGYIRKGGHHWGMEFFAPADGVGPSVALCHFGNENETDATFAQQTKNLQLVLAPDNEGNQGPFLKAGDMYGFENVLKVWQI